MGRNKTNYFKKNIRKSRNVSTLTRLSWLLPTTMNEGGSRFSLDYLTIGKTTVGKGNITHFAKNNRQNPTKAEKEFELFLRTLNGGILKNSYKKQYVMSGKFILDFFIEEYAGKLIRLGIEIDGSIHKTKAQRIKDLEKEKDCKRFDITLVRFMNHEVYGNKILLREKLRKAWKTALQRKNKIVGKIYYG